MIIWFTGNSGAGKSTLAEAVRVRVPHAIRLDGDQLRATISTDCGFSAEDRLRHNLRVAGLAKLLHDQGHTVLVAVIAPYRALRAQLTNICSPRWVHVDRVQPEDPERPYEKPGEEAYHIMNNWHNLAERPYIEHVAAAVIERFGLNRG